MLATDGDFTFHHIVQGKECGCCIAVRLVKEGADWPTWSLLCH